MNVLPLTVSIPLLLIAVVYCSYVGIPLWGWSLYFAAVLLVFNPPLWLWLTFGVAIAIMNLPHLRRRLITAPIFGAIKARKLLPAISDTERDAIDAGTVWVEGEFFTGNPDFSRLLTETYPTLAPNVQAFLYGPVEKVCQMASDWEIYQRQDLPPEVWDYLKRERFLGLTIPKEYGGLGFSNLAYSAVMMKLASRSFVHVASVGVANSLGPAKLLLRYGTPAQKQHYLPRLARGEDIPCFALTEPQAGSDAASITSEGVVFKGDNGELYLRLNWKKRYITLAAIATLLGLAFRLRDPENLLGKGKDVGITCALVAADTPGVRINQRHDPMGVPFYNSPIEGNDVIVPVGNIIGGPEQAGQGWKMLMQTLAAGRGISFPATCTGVAKLVARTAGAHAAVRQQFGLPIGRFEGIEEPLARIGGLTYLLDAARLYTCGAVDRGEQPAVVAAIAKYHSTEIARQLVNDGMDILGGAGICRGPHNLLANVYTAMPIAITVEGANILTRSLMIFGQGAIRCHPYVYQEIQALESNDLAAFDRAIWPHLGSFVRNLARTGLLGLTRGAIARPPLSDPTAPYVRKLAWASAAFALWTDLVLLGFGGSLKRHEKLTGRFADILSWLYLGTATLRRFEAEGCDEADLPAVRWAMQYALTQIQQAFEGIFANLTLPVLGTLPGRLFGWWWRANPLSAAFPSDLLGHEVARSLQTPGLQRDRLTAGIHIDADPQEALGRLEHALQLLSQAEPARKKVKAAIRDGNLPPSRPEGALAAALRANIINPEEAERIRAAEAACIEAIQVDAFNLERTESPRFSQASDTRRKRASSEGDR